MDAGEASVSATLAESYQQQSSLPATLKVQMHNSAAVSLRDASASIPLKLVVPQRCLRAIDRLMALPTQEELLCSRDVR